MPRINPERLRRTPMMRGSSFRQEAKNFFEGNDRFKGEKIAKGLSTEGGMYQGHHVEERMEELFEKAEEKGLKLSYEGKKMKESLELGSKLAVNKLVNKDTKEQLGEYTSQHQGPTKKELEKLKTKQEMLKRVHQRETAEQRQAEQEKAKGTASGKSGEQQSPKKQSSAVGGAAPIGGNLPRRGDAGSSDPSYSSFGSGRASHEGNRGDSAVTDTSSQEKTPEEPTDMAID